MGLLSTEQTAGMIFRFKLGPISLWGSLENHFQHDGINLLLFSFFFPFSLDEEKEEENEK